MQYFTQALLDGMNGEDAEHFSRILEDQIVAYRAQLKTLLPQLSQSAKTFFTRVKLQQSTLLAFTLGDALDALQNDLASYHHEQRRARVELQVLDRTETYLYTLRYTTLRCCKVDYPGDTDADLHAGGPMGPWRYDELTDAEDEFFRHEILFTSGATILLEFRHFSYQREMR